MISLKNPTADTLSVQIEGVVYTLVAGGTIKLSDSHARYWKDRLHTFLIEVSDAEVQNLAKEIATEMEKSKEVVDAPKAEESPKAEVKKVSKK